MDDLHRNEDVIMNSCPLLQLHTVQSPNTLLRASGCYVRWRLRVLPLPAHPAEVDAPGLRVDVHEVVHQPRLEVA